MYETSFYHSEYHSARCVKRAQNIVMYTFHPGQGLNFYHHVDNRGQSNQEQTDSKPVSTQQQ